MNWVKKRSECSSFEAFKRLQSEVEEDAEQRDAIEMSAPGGPKARFKVNPRQRSFRVLRSGTQISASVSFELSGELISASDDDGTVIIEGSITLSDDGECILRVGKEELLFWQFRRRALESLFFGFPSA